MKQTLSQLKPSALWGYFYELTQVPRPSGHMAPIQAFMMHFGQSLGLPTLKDAVGNIIISKPATPGFEAKTPVVLQAHLDMVPQKNSHVDHDFEKDPIRLRIEDGWLKATETTLGADNGIGVAAAMAVLAATDLEHGPIEALFTIDEETGMDGAFGLKPETIKGRTLINMDSEDEGELFVGCAGGVNVNVSFSCPQLVPVPSDHKSFLLALTGLKGGHSGMDINLGRGNANKMLFHLLKSLVGKYGVRLATYQGGTLRNAIPREAFAVVTLPSTKVKDLNTYVAAYMADLNALYAGIEDAIKVSVEPTDLPVGLLPEPLQDDVINAVVAVHDGVLRNMPGMAEMVETSSNLAIVKTEGKDVIFQFLARSSSAFMKDQLVSMIQSTCALAGAKVSTSGTYPGWMPDLKSHLMDVMVNVHSDLFGKKPSVNVIHAGLECGIIQEAVGKMEMISFGPIIRHPHSPDEKVEIASVERFWNYLIHVLKAI
ncbi:MAG: aminoacyl-histidine dipeptidase [Bacteroidales bacterium]|nr:aminoacyl-histidine dipeptidase [Bacteroidales bacterium]